MSTTTAPSDRRVGPPIAAVVAPVVVAGLVVTVVLLVVLGVLGLVVGVVLTIIAAIVRARTFGRDVESQLLAGLSSRPADGEEAAGLVSLAEGLSATAGVPVPDLRIVDAPTANAMAIGTSPESSVVIVTSGLLSTLDRIQLEGVVARVLVAIRQGSVADATWSIELSRSVLTRPFAPKTAVDPDRDVLLDRDAAGLTRYPPGLRAALEACASVGTDVSAAPVATAGLWMVDPRGGDAVRSELTHRIEALELL